MLWGDLRRCVSYIGKARHDVSSPMNCEMCHAIALYGGQQIMAML